MDTTTVISAGNQNRRLKHLSHQELGMLILAVDPGAGGTGWALLRSRDARVHNCGTLHGRGTWDQKVRQIMVGYEKLLSNHYIGQVYIESPVFMRGYGGYTTASTGDLVKLSMLCGAIYAYTMRLHGAILVEPSQWKGQLPKKVCARRIMKILHELHPYDELGRISNHAMDAIGIGLWALGKFK